MRRRQVRQVRRVRRVQEPTDVVIFFGPEELGKMTNARWFLVPVVPVAPVVPDRIRRGLNDHRASDLCRPRSLSHRACPPGDLRTPARVSASFTSRPRRGRSRRSWPTRGSCTASPACARRSRFTCSGTCRAGVADVDRVLNSSRARRASRLARSTRTSFRTRRTSTVRSGTSTRPCAARRSSTASRASRSPAALGSRDVSCWFADGSNYPGTANIRERKRWFEEGLREMHAHLAPGGRLLVEYKPFEPAFYHTDIADWGMALLLARAAGPSARVLVDTGHHYASQNIEQIVAWLLGENMLGGLSLQRSPLCRR